MNAKEIQIGKRYIVNFNGKQHGVVIIEKLPEGVRVMINEREVVISYSDVLRELEITL